MTEHPNALSRRSFLGASAILGLSTAIGATNPIDAYAVTAAEKQAEASAALAKLDAMQEKLDVASADYYTALDAQQEAQANMDATQDRIDEISDQISDLQDKLGTRARSMYRSGSLSVIDLLLGATSFTAFTTNWDILNTMNENDAEMVDQSKSLRVEAEEQKAIFEAEEARAAEEAAKAEAVKREAEALVSEMQATYDNLSSEAAALLAQEEAAREAERQRAAAAAASNGSSGGSSGGGGSSSGGGSKPSGGGSVNNNKNQTVPGSTVVERAYAHLGYPYSWGATGPNSFDCSGFVSMCLSGRYGYRLGTTYTFMGWTRVSDPKPGDVCTNSSHCGIYIGGGQMIHAPQTGDVVKVSAVRSNMIYVRY